MTAATPLDLRDYFERHLPFLFEIRAIGPADGASTYPECFGRGAIANGPVLACTRSLNFAHTPFAKHRALCVIELATGRVLPPSEYTL